MTRAASAAETIRQNALVMACVNAWESYYCWSNRLMPIGPLFLVGRQAYRGKARIFADETVLNEGDSLGSIHLNNVRISALGCQAGRHGTAWQFTRLLRASLQALAQFSTSENGAAITVYHGTTWMQPHGLKVGFITEPLAEGWRTQLLRWQFRILRACFAPAPFAARAENLEPRNFWITSTQLRSSFGVNAVR